jgi:hypothetical protein
MSSRTLLAGHSPPDPTRCVATGAPARRNPPASNPAPPDIILPATVAGGLAPTPTRTTPQTNLSKDAILKFAPMRLRGDDVAGWESLKPCAIIGSQRCCEQAIKQFDVQRLCEGSNLLGDSALRCAQLLRGDAEIEVARDTFKHLQSVQRRKSERALRPFFLVVLLEAKQLILLRLSRRGSVSTGSTYRGAMRAARKGLS